jgi:hypothetical protein
MAAGNKIDVRKLYCVTLRNEWEGERAKPPHAKLTGD